MTNRSTLPDTRPYPATPVKGDLLLYAGQIAHAKTGAERKIAQETLCTKIAEMFAQRHPLWLSVAMSMSPDPETYIALMDGIDEVLRAKTDDEVQWFALPVVVVAGTKQPAPLPESCPAAELCAVLENYPALRPLSHAQWLPQLLRADDFAQITASLPKTCRTAPQNCPKTNPCTSCTRWATAAAKCRLLWGKTCAKPHCR